MGDGIDFRFVKVLVEHGAIASGESEPVGTKFTVGYTVCRD